MSDEQIIETLIQSVTHLTRHLEAENHILKRRDPAALAPMADEKGRLSADYLAVMDVIKRNPSLVQNLPPETRDRLRQAGEAFNATMEEHHRRVSTLKTVGEGVIRAISEHVSTRNCPASYGQGDSNARRQNTAPTSIAIDRNI